MRRSAAFRLVGWVAVVLVAGCSAVPTPAPTPTAAESPAASAPSEPAATAPEDGSAAEGPTPGAEVRAQGVALTSGGITAWVLGDDVQQTAVPDGAVTVTLAVPADTTSIARIAVPEGLVPTALMDGSVVLSDASGVPVGGLSAPELHARPLDAPGDLTSTVARLAVRADVVDLVLAPATASGDVTVTVQLGTAAIASTAWGEREGGRSLAVVPTDWLRGGALAAQQVGWAQLLAAEPEVDTVTMRDQFDCHALGARDKASWNLEPWRPDVGALAVLAARCNPT